MTALKEKIVSVDLLTVSTKGEESIVCGGNTEAELRSKCNEHKEKGKKR